MMTEQNYRLHPRSTVAEVEAEMERIGVPLQSAVNGPPYATDRHFRYALMDISTAAQAQRFCDDLDAECNGYCAKAFVIRAWLKQDYWTRDSESLRIAIAHGRRTCCRNHETGSFAKRA